MALHLASFWNRGLGQLGNGLLDDDDGGDDDDDDDGYLPKKRTANENAARIRVDQQPKDITYFSNKKFALVVGL